MVRVLVCDDQTVVREGLAAILGTDPEIEVVALAGNGAELLELVPEARPDVVLMDLRMPVMDGVQATERLRREHPQIYVLVLTTYGEDRWLFEAMQAGASGYLLKDTRRDDLIAAIKGTAKGKTYLDPSIAGRLLRQVVAGPPAPVEAKSQAETLTQRELEILRLLVQGYSNPEIAQRLHLARGTVRNYVSTILQKLGVPDRTQAAVVALKRGLVDGTQ